MLVCEQGPAWLREMVRIRAFEETLREEYAKGTLPGGVHLAVGQEAVAAGFGGLLESGDLVTTGHRGHHHMVARGLDVRRMYAEIQGKSTGYCRGKGGSMHIQSLGAGLAGANGVVAGGIPMTWGIGVALKEFRTGNVAVSFFGEGAANQGVLYEVLNLAACWETPIVFVCENNGWSQFSASERVTAGESIAARAAAFAIPSVRVDGNDVVAVHEAADTALRRARSGAGPSFVECLTARWRGHHEGEERYAGQYREPEEYPDPLARLAGELDVAGLGGDRLLATALETASLEMRAAFDAAQADPDPAPETAFTHVYA